MILVRAYTNVPIELSLPQSFSSDFLSVSSHSVSYSLPVFQKSDTKRYVRFSSSDIGAFQYAIGKKKQTIVVEKYKGKNALFLHGPVTLSKNKKFLVYWDNTPFFYLADTWWYGATKRSSEKAFSQLLKDRLEKGFTAVQLVVGIPPEVDAFNENVKNDGGFPFTKDWSLHQAYFDAVDKRIEAIVHEGLVPVIFGGWGHHVDWMGVETVKRLWHELIARYASYPVIFSLCGEADVFLVPSGIDPKTADTVKTKTKKLLEKLPRPFFNMAVKTKRFGSTILYQRQEKNLLQTRIRKWSKVGSYVHSIDPYKRILTTHPHRQITAFDLFDNPSWLTLNTIQSGHTLSAIPFMVSSLMQARKPIINFEPWYEGIAGNFDDYYQRLAFWYCILSGAKGHSYGAHGIWQMANQDNYMRHWGESDWTDAMKFEGAGQIGKAKLFLTSLGEWETIVDDNAFITPRFSQNDPYFPLCGKTENYTLVYVPDQRRLPELTFSSLKKKFVSVYNPATLAKIKTVKLDGNKIEMPIDESERDVLLHFEER